MAKTLRTTRYTWDPKSLRYRSPSGRFVTQRAFKQSFNSHLRRSAAEVQRLADDVHAGRITVREWQRQMVNAVKAVHLESAAAARGGWAQMTKSDFGKVGAGLKFHYRKLRQFAKELRRLPLGAVRARASMYVLAGGGVYENTRRDAASDVFAQERNVLGKSEHCQLCKDQTAKGWVEVGTLVPIGQRTCLTRCRCRYDFR